MILKEYGVVVVVVVVCCCCTRCVVVVIVAKLYPFGSIYNIDLAFLYPISFGRRDSW